MAKKVISVIAGIIAGTILIYLVEMLCAKIYPPPPGVDIMQDKQALIEFIRNAPLNAMLLVLAGYIAGSFAAGLVSARISGNMLQPVIAGTALMLFGIMNLFELPQPLWFAVSTTLSYIPFAYLGGKLGVKQ